MRIFGIFLSVVFTGIGLGFVYYYWPLRLEIPSPSVLEIVTVLDRRTSIIVPSRVLVGELVEFDDGLFAFLMFDHLRGRPLLANHRIMLKSTEKPGQPLYRILVQLPNDLISAVTFLAELKAEKLTSSLQFRWIFHSELVSDIYETSVFMEAYSGPASYRLRAFHAPELEDYLRRFIRFKSETDPRISSSLQAIPSPLTRKDASRLAADIIAVARFYDVPIDLFLGIGAMENNYMNVAGDLKNTIWKKRAQPGDIILKRKRGRVLVRNDSMGVWQITRESLRYGHRLYLNDKRDYTQLPERLRPPRKLAFESVDPDVLTTYAGLLLRDLLDRFHGDVTMAAGAYNGGPDNPNVRYAAGVEMVASYARRIIGRAAEINRVELERSSVSSEKINDKTLSTQVTERPSLR